MPGCVGDNEDNRPVKSIAARVRKAAAVRLGLKAAGRKISDARLKGKMNPRRFKSGSASAASGDDDTPELARGMHSVDNTPLVTPTDLEFGISSRMNEVAIHFGGSRDGNEVARRPSILTDSNTSGYTSRTYTRLHPAKPTRLYASGDEGKENRPPVDQTLHPITDYLSPPPAPRVDNGSFDFEYILPHLGVPNTNTVTEPNWSLRSFTNMNPWYDLEDNVTPKELEGSYAQLGLDVLRTTGAPPEGYNPAQESEHLMLDYPTAPRPDMGDWSADILEEVAVIIPVPPESLRARLPDGILFSHSVAQSLVGTGTEDRSFGWDTGLGLTLDMVADADADAEFSGMNSSLGDISVDNSLSVYTPESSFFHSSYGVMEDSTVGLFPRTVGARSRLELDAPLEIAPVEDKLLGLGLGSSSRRTLGSWSSSSAPLRNLDENGYVAMADPTRRAGSGLSHLDNFSLSRLEKLHWSHLDKSSPGAALSPGMCSTSTLGSVRATAAAHTHTRGIDHGLYARDIIPGQQIRGTDRRTYSRDMVPGERAYTANNGTHAFADMSNYGDLLRGWTLLPPIELDY